MMWKRSLSAFLALFLLLSGQAGAWEVYYNYNSGTAASGYVLASDGLGGASWVAPGVAVEVDPIVSAINGIVKSDGAIISAAIAGTDYVAPNAAIVGATKTKITYDSKGLVTAGADATAADVGAQPANANLTTISGWTLQDVQATASPSFDGLTVNKTTDGTALAATALLNATTGNESAFTFNYTTNKLISGNDSGLVINQTDTTSPGTSYLIDAQVGGTSKFDVTNTGQGYFANNVGIGIVPVHMLDILKDQNASTYFRITNNNNTAGATVGLYLVGSSGGVVFGYHPPNYTGVTGWNNRATVSMDATVDGFTVCSPATNGDIRFETGGVGTANEKMRITSAGNISIGNPSFGTSATKTIAVASGTPPASSPADAFQVYSADSGGVAGKAAFHTRAESGQITGIGSHINRKGGTAPTLSACGTTPAISTGSDDAQGIVTMDADGTGCVITFATAYGVTPNCIVAAQTSANLTSYTVSTTAITVVGLPGIFNYHCYGQNE